MGFILDGDMICKSDLKELWDQRNEKYAVQVVKHNYKTKMNKKYFGNVNENYPRKIGQVLFCGIANILRIDV